MPADFDLALDLNNLPFFLTQAVKDEIITDLVSQCRSNQQKLMQFVSSTG
jgi:hypothetical protein